jgi:DNA repair exonuclease SbcCD ATPase subunit
LNRTPLPGPRVSAPTEPDVQGSDETDRLREENRELRNLVEQAIAQEEEFDRLTRQWKAEVDARDRQLHSLAEQVGLLKSGGGDAAELIGRLQERDETVRLLSEQVQQLELHLQYDQAGGNEQQYLQAIQERDQAIEELTARAGELEAQLASIPPPPPNDEELARMADELERERNQIAQLRKELEQERRQHADDVTDFERQMREMEVQLSRERAEMARQRTELNRLQAEVRSEMEAIQRGDGVLRERLAHLQQRRQSESSAGTAAPKSNGPAPAKRDKDSGFMRRLFGKQ